jgi:ATP-dependent Clp protease ATP-binding subunit ClpC
MLALTNLHAQRLGHDHVSSEHFLLGALALGVGVGPSILSNAGLAENQIRSYLAAVGPTTEPVSQTYGTSGHRVFESAGIHVAKLRHSELEPEHMILALLDETDGGVAKALEHFGVDRAATRQLLFERMSQPGAAT